MPLVEEAGHRDTSPEAVLIGSRMGKGPQTMAVNTLLLLGTCYIVLAAGVCLALLIGQRRRAQLRKLQTQGKRVIAIVTDVQQEREERGPAAFPLINYCYFIEAQWTDPQTGTTYWFKSNRLVSSPKEYSRGTFVHVLIDPTHPTRYVMELPEYDV
jgi:hypothetical protein